MKLEVKHKRMTEYFVERDDQVEALMELLEIESSDVRFVGIHGMGGIGKTTLAKAVFNKICDRFDCSSFQDDVRESSRQHKGIEQLQKQLLSDLGLKYVEIRDVDDGITRIRDFLAQKKVLIVLDDVDHRKQIRSLARDPSWFGSRSRIIITTRDQEVLEMEHTLEVEVMRPEEARELFCMLAFKEGAPPDAYLSLLEDAVASTGRLPLALEVIGSHLRNKTYQDWVAIIKRLEKTPHRDVREKLMISYESLNDRTKQIFLDIACFFIGEEKAYPVYMWQACNFDPEMGLKELIDKSLVKITEEDGLYSKRGPIKRNMLRMHDQIRDLGMAIVRDMSVKDGVKPSRTWLHEDASKMLLGEEGQEHLEMLRIHNYDYREGYTFSQKQISGLKKLRYLECCNRNFSGDLEDMLPKLRWLCWWHAPPKIKGTGTFLRNLVILNLYGSDIDENWNGWTLIGVESTLKVLNLSYCDRLTRTPDLSSYSSLEILILSGCSNLVEIDPSIGKLKALKHLDVSGCKTLKAFPEEVCSLYSLEVLLVSSDYSKEGRFHMPEMIGDLTSLLIFRVGYVKFPKYIVKIASLCHLSLVGCSGVGVVPDTLGDMESLVELDLSHTDVAELPDTIGQLLKVEVLSLIRCESLKKLPISMGNMSSLVKLDLSYSGMTELPDSIGNLENLRVMDMSRTQIKELPSSFGMLKMLEELDATWTPLEKIPPDAIKGLTSLRVLKLKVSGDDDASEGNSEDASDESGSSQVHPIKKLEGIEKLRSLVELELDLWNVTCIPEDEGLSSLLQLQSLFLGCPNLHHCPPLPPTLSHLTLYRRGEKKTRLPRLSNLKNLSTLDLHGCCISDDTVGNLGFGALESLTSLSLWYCEIGNLLHLLPANLQKLHIRHCSSLEALPALSHLKNLKELMIESAHSLVEIPELELESLQSLYITHCDSLRGRLQNLSKLKMLRSIRISFCPKFQGVDGIGELEFLESLSIQLCDCENVYSSFPRKTQEGSYEANVS